jgi:S-adenosyl-L-methionine hydrolase (adenosine-forming)
MARPLIALLTDFGLRDHYAGTMKGVALGVCPEITFVDISHDIPPHDVLGGALELAAAYRYFPHGTIFLVVVDPGVGSSRRGIAAETSDYRFVAPDNGVLSLVFDQTVPKRVVELTDRRYARPTISRTFEGRDRFAPAAGWLAKGLDLAALGRSAGSVVRLEIPSPRVTEEGVDGEVLRVDRFGNLITNIDRVLLEKMSGPIAVQVGSRDIPRIVSTYADASAGELCALVGSSDHLEIAVNGGNAAEALGLGRGGAVQLRRGA